MATFYPQKNPSDALGFCPKGNRDAAVVDPAPDPRPTNTTVVLNPRASVTLPTRTTQSRVGKGTPRSNSGSSKETLQSLDLDLSSDLYLKETQSRRKSEPDYDPNPSFQRLAFVTVLDPAQLKDRANRKIEHVHSKREYFRRKRLKSMQEAQDDAPRAATKPKEIAMSIASYPQGHPVPSPHKNHPSETCDGSRRNSYPQCQGQPLPPVDNDVRSRSSSSSSSSSSASSSPTTIYADFFDGNAPFDSSSSSFALSLHHQTNVLNTGSIDPFGSFPVQSNPEIGLLMDSFVSNFSHGSLLTVNGPKLPTNFGVIFQLSLTDWSLFNSMLYLGSGASKYHAEAIRLLNEKLKNPSSATDNASMIAILIWSDLSISGGNDRPKHDSHMRGLRKLLKMRNQSQEVQESLSERGLMERGILWADLAGASLLGAPRFFAHDAFSTVKLSLPVPRQLISVPHGFEINAEILGLDLLQVIQEICDFRGEIESQSRAGLTFDELSALDDRKASIEWRLTTMQDREINDPMKECCRLAIHICSSAFFPAFFGPSKMPTSLSQRLSQTLSRSDLDSCWNQHVDLLLWVVFIGASRTKSESDLPVYTKALTLVLSQFGTMCETWEQTVLILETFIWSEKVFGESCRALWAQANPFRQGP